MTDFKNVRSGTLRGDPESLARFASRDSGALASNLAVETSEGVLRVGVKNGKLRLVVSDD